MMAEETPQARLLKQIQDALVECFYDPDPADSDSTVDYEQVDWVGVIRDVRAQLDKLKSEKR